LPRCIFCDSNKISKEHVWGKWWLKHVRFPSSQNSQRFPHYVLNELKSGDLSFQPGVFSNVGHPLAKTTKVVCKECNNGWGSSIEDEMQKAFVTLYQCSGKLTVSQVEAVKRWIFLKLCLQMRAYISGPIKGHRVHRQLGSKVFHMKPISKKEKADYVRKRLCVLEKLWKSFRDTNQTPESFSFFISHGEILKRYGACNYIPQSLGIQFSNEMAMSENNNALLLGLHTCLFEVGDFLAVVTNDPDVENGLTDFSRWETGAAPILKLISGQGVGPIISKIPFYELEDFVLRILESKKDNTAKTTLMRSAAHPKLPATYYPLTPLPVQRSVAITEWNAGPCKDGKSDAT